MLVLPVAAQAVPDEEDHYTVDEYRYDRDGDTPMRVNDDPGNGGPQPTGVPLGSDLASVLVFVGGAWYARRRLQTTR